MKREEVNKLAHECKLPYYFRDGEIVGIENLELFAEKIESLVLESAAKICEQVAKSYMDNNMPTAAVIAAECAGFVRARK